MCSRVGSFFKFYCKYSTISSRNEVLRFSACCFHSNTSTLSPSNGIHNKYSKNNATKNKTTNNYSRHILSATIFFSIFGIYYYYNYFFLDKKRAYALKQGAQDDSKIPGVRKPNLKTYTEEEVGKHDNEKDGIWVCYKEGVYDITKFVLEHPGGPQKIMMAAGASIEPFWAIFANHNSPEIYELLESMRIGNLEVDTTQKPVAHDDPYANDPKRHKALKVNGPKPFCGETPSALLAEAFLTPVDIFYVRNHLPVPEVDINDYTLEISVEDDTKKVLDFESIKKYPKYTVTTAVMCGGNRRSEMNAVKPLRGLSWGVGAVGNAKWSGARLVDVLSDLKINENDWNHIQFEGLDMDPAGVPYGGSIPIGRALDPRADIILAYEMNGEPIPRDHGYPIRAIVPGVVGARNVKWLGRIVISKDESPSQFQRGDYKGFSPSVDWDTVDFSKSPAILDMPVISAICDPVAGDTVAVDKNGKIHIKGYAWSGGGKKIIRVDVTADQGKTWHVADHLIHDDTAKEGRHWSWTLWTADIPVELANSKNNEVEIWAKAVDASYNVQPESFENIWNLRGLLCNAYHRVKVKISSNK